MNLDIRSIRDKCTDYVKNHPSVIKPTSEVDFLKYSTGVSKPNFKKEDLAIIGDVSYLQSSDINIFFITGCKPNYDNKDDNGPWKYNGHIFVLEEGIPKHINKDPRYIFEKKLTGLSSPLDLKN